MKPTPQDVLLVIDVQNDFCPGGQLAVPAGDEVVPVIRRVAAGFEHVVLTQDWHTASHASFASAHPGKQAFEQIEASYGPQTLWPDHCVQGTHGADFHPALQLTRAELVLRKGFRLHIDSYSAFSRMTAPRQPGLAAICASADSLASSWLAWLTTSVWATRRSTHGGSALRLS